MLDLRIPIGAFFTVVGVILLAMGVLAPNVRAALAGGNVNLDCGAAMTAFGAFMLLLSWRAARNHS
jgi:hypothetical protein